MKRNGGYLVTKIKQLGDRIFEKLLVSRNINAFNGPQGRILYVLYQKDGVPIKTLSEESGMALSSLTTMLERMERTGLIRREQSARDKRKTLLYLTEKSMDLHEDYFLVSEEMNSIFYKGFSEEEIDHFEAYLERIWKNLEEHGLEPCSREGCKCPAEKDEGGQSK